METITLQEFKKIQNEQKYKHIGLFKTDGSPIVNFNSNSIKPAARINEIETRLHSKALPDGIYIIKAKNYISKTTPTDDFFIQKGKANLSESINFTPSPDVRTYESALADQTKIIRLETELAAAKKTIEELEKIIAEYESEPEEIELEENETLGEQPQGGAPAWLNSVLQIATPLLDKHYELKQKALEIEEKRLAAQPIAQPTAPPINDAAINTMFARLKNWINSIEDAETKQAVKSLYQNSETLDGFFDQLDEFYPDLADELEAAFNEGGQQ